MSLRVKIVLAMLMVGLLPLVLLGSVYYFDTVTSIEASKNRAILSLTAQVATEVERSLREAYHSVLILSENPLLTDEKATRSQLEEVLERTQQLYPILNDITFINANGHVRASVSYSFRGDFKATTWFKSVMAGKPSLSRLHALIYPLRFVMTASVPIRGPDGAIRGAIVGQIEMKRIWEVTNGVRLGKEGRALLVNDLGLVVASPDKTAIMETLPSPQLLVAMQAHNQETAVVDVGDLKWLCAFVALEPIIVDPPSPQWHIVLMQPVKEAYYSSRQIRKGLNAAIAFSVFGVIILGFSFTSRISKRIQVLVDATRHLGAGELDFRLQELGGDEIGQLAKSFNYAFEKLEESRTELEEYQRGLETLVEQRTSELQRSNVQLQAEVDDHRRTEVALRDSESKFLHLANNIKDVFWIGAPERRQILYVSPACQDIYGYSPEQLHNQAELWLNAVHETDRKRITEALHNPSTSPFELEYRIVRPDNSVRFVRDRVFPVLDEQGGLFRLIGIAEDISERKLAEQEKQKLEEQLLQSQKMEAVGTLAGGIAHDFNNLLQVILGYSEFLKVELENTEFNQKALDAIANAATRGSELTQHLLTFSRRLDSQLKPVDLNKIVDRTYVLLQRTIPKMIQIDLHLDENLRAVNADSVQIEQIIYNLAINAWDAMSDGGRLAIETDMIDLDGPGPRWHPDAVKGEYVRLKISDTGIGMCEETREHIFDPFYTTKPVGKGTGLGLAVVYGIIQNHKGFIKCRSEPGIGTSFEVCLPAVDDKAFDFQASPVLCARGQGQTVLLVDDEEVVREFVKDALQANGYQVLTAANGETGMEIYRARHNEIHLVLLDLIMPGMGGRKCLEEILAFDSSAKVAIASGFSPEFTATEMLEMGAKAFLSKPFDMSKLLNGVSDLLNLGS